MQALGYFLVGLWILGVAFLFFVRFSAAFYRANKPAIDAAVSNVRGHLGDRQLSSRTGVFPAPSDGQGDQSHEDDAGRSSGDAQRHPER